MLLNFSISLVKPKQVWLGKNSKQLILWNGGSITQTRINRWDLTCSSGHMHFCTAYLGIRWSFHDWLQVGAHGTGARLPPIDEQVISMKLVTPAKGTIELSREKDPDLFYLARCGLGGLGVVAEVTLQCVERHQLIEHTFVSSADEVKKNHK